MSQSEPASQKKKPAPKQIAAIVCIVLLVAMYIVTLILALIDNPVATQFFGAAVIATFAVPLLAWIYIWMYGMLTKKPTIADIHFLEDVSPSGKYESKTDKASAPGCDEQGKASDTGNSDPTC